MISLDEFLQIRHQFHNERREIPQIAQNLGLDKKTIAKWARQADYVPRRSGHRQSKLDSFKPTIMKLVKEQGLSAMHIYQLLRDDGYEGGYTILKTFVSNERIGAPVNRLR
jgi:transposase